MYNCGISDTECSLDAPSKNEAQATTMKLTSLVSALALVNTVTAIEKGAVFRFDNGCNDGKDKHIKTIPQTDATLNLAYDFGVSPFYNIAEVQDLENVMLGNKKEDGNDYEKDKLIIIINGVDKPSKFLKEYDVKPVYKVKFKDDRQSSKFKSFLQKVPEQLSQLKEKAGYQMSSLSNEISILSDSNKKVSYLESIWNKYFHFEEDHKLQSMWKNVKESIAPSNSESILKISIDKRSLDLINDSSFINELTQLDFFLNEELENNVKDGIVIVNIDSLISIFKKTGSTQTYETCKKIISKLLVEKLEKVGETVTTTLVVLPLDQSLKSVKCEKKLKSHRNPQHKEHHKEHHKKDKPQHGERKSHHISPQMLNKRSEEDIFSAEKFQGACYKNQLECIESTESCSGHGTCTLVGSCYQCECLPTRDDNKRTTYWTGAACEKVDYSSQFNLLFWTSLVLLVTIVGGIKLLVSCGSEELPGVLKAATVQTKKAI